MNSPLELTMSDLIELIIAMFGPPIISLNNILLLLLVNIFYPVKPLLPDESILVSEIGYKPELYALCTKFSLLTLLILN